MIEGELLFEPLERAPYAVDASLYEIDPLGVVTPRTEADVVTLVKYSSEHAIPIHARGAGTGTAGESLGPGLVIDFSRHFRRIIQIGPDRVAVQPGVVLDVLNTELAPLGRKLGPDPYGSESCTIGGMIGIDAAGPRSLRLGTMGDHVERLRVVFANGEVAELGRSVWPGFDDEPADFQAGIVRKLGAVVRRNGDLIARRSPRSPRNRAGYALGRAADPAGIDLARLVVGSEGTLALVTEALLRTVPIPAAQGVILFPFPRIGDAASAVMDCLSADPSVCELFDWRSIRLVRDAIPAFRDWIAEVAEAVLIVEFEGDDTDEVARRVRDLSRRIAQAHRLVDDPVEVLRRADAERLLGLRRAVEPLLMRMKGPARPVAFIEDVAVPPEAMPDLLHRLQNILKQYDVSWTLDAHAGHGQVHTRPFLDMADPRDADKLEPLATQVYEAALELGGTISGEHGCGLVRTQFLRRQFGELVQVFREIKDAFDPLNLLNPGKVIGDDPHLMTRDLRRRSSTPAPAVTEPSRARPNRPSDRAGLPARLALARARTAGDRVGV